MLTAIFNNNLLQVRFDIGIPTSCYHNHPELTQFMTRLEPIKHISWNYDDQKTLHGLSIPYAILPSVVAALLPEREADIQIRFFENIQASGMTCNVKGLDINFHQNPFDSPERHWQFILNQGHFAAYFFNRINWYLGPKNNYITEFPLHVDLEAASTCNMNCPMCYRDGLKHTGQMGMELFKKAVDECFDNHVFSIRLSWRGETLTHPRIKEMVAYATERIKNVSFLTNAFYLTDDIMESLIDSGLSYLAVSFDGIDDIYEKIRHPAKFSENYQILERLRTIRTEKNALIPQVRLCTIWPAIRDNPDAYYQKMKPVSDYIVCNPYINFKGPMKIKPDFICQYPWERIVVAYNGDTQCCTGWNADDIILGNITNKTIHDMWHSRQMNSIRETHAKHSRMSLTSCAQCRHGSKGDPDIDIDTILNRRY